MHQRTPWRIEINRRKLFGVAGAIGASTLVAPARAAQTGLWDTHVETALAGLDDLVTSLMEQTGVPGIAVGVVHRDEVVHLAGYGVREVGKPEPIDPDTVFQLASVSKGMAATTVAAAIGDGVAGWDAPVHELYPEFELSEPWTTHAVTVRDLFCHRSGLPEHAGDILEDLGFSRDEVIRRLRYYEPVGPFRDTYNYTNFGLSAAAYAVARAAEIEWDDLAETRLYQPLGMTSTSSRFADYMAHANRAIPHMQLADGSFAFVEQRRPDAQTPAGGVSSNVRDMAQYLRMLLGGGALDGEEIVDAFALGETFRPHIATERPANPLLDRSSFYGLGWNVGVDNQGQTRFNHSGAFALGAATVVSFIPSAELGIVVLSNGLPIGAVETIALSFLDLATTGEVAFDYYPILSQIFAAQLTPPYDHGIDFDTPPSDFTDHLPLVTYVGDYENDLYGTVGVVESDGGLTLELGPDRTPYPMRHYTGDRFSFEPPGENAGAPSLVTFTIGPDGNTNRVTIDYLDKEGHGTLARVTAGD